MRSNILKSSKTYYPLLDTTRFFAAFLVLLSHWIPDSSWIKALHLGNIGVDLFFVISGFLISRQLLEQRTQIEAGTLDRFKAFKNFVWKRAWRIFPLYYLILILSTLLNKGEIRDAFLYNMSYLSNFYFIKVEHWTRNFSHFWSLSVEEHFYLFWPLAVLFLPIKRFFLYSTVIALFSIGFRTYHILSDSHYLVTYCHTLSVLDLFMVGAIAGQLKKNKTNLWISNRMLILSTLAFISMIALSYFLQISWMWCRACSALFYAVIVLTTTQNGNSLLQKILSNKILVWLGTLSYSIYLLHIFIPGIVMPLKTFGLSIFLRFPIYLLLTIGISALLHQYFEKPLRKFGKNSLQ